MTVIASAANALVNFRMAEAIVAVARQVCSSWDDVPTHARYWLRAAIAYFTTSDDSEPDFDSPIGFEDDLEVLNACLKLAGRSDLYLRPEDYDDV